MTENISRREFSSEVARLACAVALGSGMLGAHARADEADDGGKATTVAGAMSDANAWAQAMASDEGAPSRGAGDAASDSAQALGVGASPEVTKDEGGAISIGGVTLLPYTQYASGGVPTDLYAVILFENKNSTFTRYQVAYTSCTCRDVASNYRSVAYVELLNTKDTADEAAIRSISYTTAEGANAGVWGDSNPVHGRPDYTQAYMDEHLVQPLVGVTKAEVDAWQGYGDTLPEVDADAVAGATVTTSNITSMLRALFEYHANKYYAGK